MKYIRSLQLFVIVFLCSVFVFGLQYGGKTVLLHIFDTTDGFKNGTMIGNVNISGKVMEQAEATVQKEVQKWKDSTQIQLDYNGTKATIPSSVFSFRVSDSMKGITNGGRAPLQVTLQKEQLHALLANIWGEDILSHVDMKKLEQSLLKEARQLSSPVNAFSMMQFVDQDKLKQMVSEQSISSISPYHTGLQEWMKQYETVTVPPKSEVSLLKLAKDKNINIDDSALSAVASLMYKTILPTNFQITYRNISRELPAFAELGTEARVVRSSSDFIFFNPNESPYTFHFQLEQNRMTATLQGLPFVCKYNANRSEVTEIPVGTIVQVETPKPMKNDAITTPRKGKKGYTVKVYREQLDSNGNVTKREFVAEDYYLQVNEVKRVTLMPKVEPPAPVQQQVTPPGSTQPNGSQVSGTQPNEPQGTKGAPATPPSQGQASQ